MDIRAHDIAATPSGTPDLDRLGSEGWELIAIRGEEWILKRPAPDPAERFTLEEIFAPQLPPSMS